MIYVGECGQMCKLIWIHLPSRLSSLPRLLVLYLPNSFLTCPLYFSAPSSLWSIFGIVFIMKLIRVQTVTSIERELRIKICTIYTTAATTIYTMAAVIIGCCFNNHPQIQITGYSHALYKDNQMYPVICFDIYRSDVYTHSGGGSRETGEKLAAIETFLQLETVRI